MADEKSSGAWSGSIVVAGIAAVSALYVAFQHPNLVSTRPQEAEYQGHQIAAAQDIDARLWQDPFDAVARDRDANDAHNPPAGNADLREGYDLHGRPDDLAIVVTLSGAPYPEVAETRRRLRYAVLAALHFRGFMPSDEKHIGYFSSHKFPFVPSADDIDGPLNAATDQKGFDQVLWRLATATQATMCPATSLPKTIPFEQFEAAESTAAKSRPHVLLLWVDEDFLSSIRTPIASLAQLRCVLGSNGYGRFTVLGPRDSTTLQIMAYEKFEPVGGGPCHDPPSIYNFGATAAARMISAAALA